MPNYVLYYFNGRGRAEICRLLFEAAGVKYEDKRIEFSEWKEFRDKMPNSMLPVLEIDRKIRIPQSMAISRYLAREFGLHGKTNIEMARIEFICDCFYDIFNDYMKMYHEKDGRLLASMGTDCRIRSSDLTGITSEMRQAYMETCRRILPFLEKTLKMCNNGGQYFMGSQITMADLMCYSALENPLLENPTLLQEYPKLQALRTRVAEHAQLSIYFNRRHKTDF
ncbi:S-crystallin 4-like [Octopus sinensis]|uniref:S-crystallin 4-like n=1 Tax=Octopus sinensis TaxID=2607531 RepID=A0A7E6EUU9_9MOLL|nr:S-crystallin 4-like [Octopus sinensis]